MRFHPEDFTYPFFLVMISYFVNDYNQLAQNTKRISISRAHFPKKPSDSKLFSLARIGEKLYFTDLNVLTIPKKEVTTDTFLQILLLIWQDKIYLSHGEPRCYSPFKSMVTQWLKDQPMQTLIKKHIDQLTEFLPTFYPVILQIIAEYVLEPTEIDSALRTSIGLFKDAKQHIQVSEIAPHISLKH